MTVLYHVSIFETWFGSLATFNLTFSDQLDKLPVCMSPIRGPIGILVADRTM